MQIEKRRSASAVMTAGLFIGWTGLLVGQTPSSNHVERSKSASGSAKAIHWKVQVVGQQVLTSLKGQDDVTEIRPVLALKVSIVTSGDGDAFLSEGQIRLVPASGKPCMFFALGSGNSGFDQFNFYASPQTGWFNPGYPKIDYKEKEGEAPIFGLRQMNSSKLPVLQIYSKSQVVLFGFRIPPAGGHFQLKIGNAAPVTVTVHSNQR